MKHKAKNGFALIEVLVGLAVLSIALLAGLRAIANGADNQLAGIPYISAADLYIGTYSSGVEAIGPAL